MNQMSHGNINKKPSVLLISMFASGSVFQLPVGYPLTKEAASLLKQSLNED